MTILFGSAQWPTRGLKCDDGFSNFLRWLHPNSDRLDQIHCHPDPFLVAFLQLLMLSSAKQLAMSCASICAPRYSLLLIMQILYHPRHDDQHDRTSHHERIALREPRSFNSGECQNESPGGRRLTDCVHHHQRESSLFGGVSENVLCPAL